MSRQGLPTKLFAATLLLSLAGVCGLTRPRDAAAATTQGTHEVVKTNRSEGVIIPGERAGDFVKGVSRPDENEFWTPGRNDVLRLEKRIAGYLKKAGGRARPDLWSRLPSYKRQYVGVVRGGRKMIYASFFCQTHGLDWKTNPILVLDGGDCYFSVWHDPASGAFSNLQINGEA